MKKGKSVEPYRWAFINTILHLIGKAAHSSHTKTASQKESLSWTPNSLHSPCVGTCAADYRRGVFSFRPAYAQGHTLHLNTQLIHRQQKKTQVRPWEEMCNWLGGQRRGKQMSHHTTSRQVPVGFLSLAGKFHWHSEKMAERDKVDRVDKMLQVVLTCFERRCYLTFAVLSSRWSITPCLLTG